MASSSYRPDSGRYTLPPEQTVALTDESSPAYLPGFFQIALGSVIDSPRIIEKARRRRRAWLARARARRARGLRALLPAGLQRASGGRVAAGARGRDRSELEQGALVADVGCGHGASTILMAKAFPNSTFVGSDYHEWLDRDRAPAGGRRRGRRPRQLPDRPRGGVQWLRLRPGDDVRLPARHGRPGRRGAPRALDAQA